MKCSLKLDCEVSECCIKSILFVSGVANSLDLIDRLLPRLQASRHSESKETANEFHHEGFMVLFPTARPRLLHFKPNHRDEIVEIIRSKVPRHVTVDPMALQLCARKIFAQAGDLRKANDFLAHASALSGGQVEITHMARAISAATSGSMADRSPLPLHQQLVAITLLTLCCEGSKKAFSLSKVGWGVVSHAYFFQMLSMFDLTALLVIRQTLSREET